MKKIYLFLLLNTGANFCFGQKALVDTAVYGRWPTLGKSEISSKGDFILYSINNEPYGRETLVLQSISGNWKEIITDAREWMILDNNTIVFINKGDSLCLMELGKNNKLFIPQIVSYKVPVDNRNYIAYKVKNANSELVLRNVETAKEIRFKNVIDFSFDNMGKRLLLQINAGLRKEAILNLQVVNLADYKVMNVGKASKVTRAIFDNSGTRIAYIENSGSDIGPNHTIWYYKDGMNGAIPLVDSSSLEMKEFFISEDRLAFNEDGKVLFFALRKKIAIHLDIDLEQSNVNIWDYKDKYLKSEQLSTEYRGTSSVLFNSVINIDQKRVSILDDENVTVSVYPERIRKKYVLGKKRNAKKKFYELKEDESPFLVSLYDGAIKVLPYKRGYSSYSLSPDERFVIWFDMKSLSYYSYEISSEKITNISKAIPFPVYEDLELYRNGRTKAFGIAGWTQKDNFIFIYDRFDIWQVDPKGIISPKNITQGYGREKQIIWGLVELDPNLAIDSKQDLLLAGYRNLDKSNGLIKINLKETHRKIDEVIMEPYCYYVPRIGLSAISNVVESAAGNMPIKAIKSDRWLVQRMNARQAPNLFVTKDFKSFSKISSINPEKDYNWLKTELISWHTLDSFEHQGILYMPENFDSSRKYPVIFNYYAKRSDLLNKYLEPDFTRADIDIPSFVSNGYLVFVPDIYFQKNHMGKGVLNSLEAAVDYLSRFSWVDTTKLGLSGHSFGGWETNYLITHSDKFAAASEAAGVSDQISSYGQLNGDGESRQQLYELGVQIAGYGVGVTPWTNPELYIENSPIFAVDKVVCPLLMMHCKDDAAVPFAQAIEMFTGLRRAGKKVWLLQYEKEGHIIMNRENAMDYTIRTRQFFDYYLKGEAAPKWMKEDIQPK